jgi:hypothetical protein
VGDKMKRVFLVVIGTGLFLIAFSCLNQTVSDQDAEQRPITLIEDLEAHMVIHEAYQDAMQRDGLFPSRVVVHTDYYKDKEISRGDIVFVSGRSDSDNHTIGRIIALPNETIKIKSGQVYIDGARLNTFYGHEYYWNGENAREGKKKTDSEVELEMVKMKENEYFVAADNWWRANIFGVKSKSEIEGKVIGYNDGMEDMSERITIIQLEDETKIQSPSSVRLSSTKSHRFSIQFDEPMNTISVEKQLKYELPADTQFEWKGNQYLRFTVQQTDLNDVYERTIPVDVNGSMTVSGARLTNQLKFHMIITSPMQIWEYSSTSGKEEQLTSFDTFYHGVHPLNQDAFVLFRETDYCQCDREIPMLTYLYELGSEPVFYSEGIQLNLLTDQPFIVDSRGFFLPMDSSRFDHQTQYRVEPEGYVVGAKVMPDGETLVMALGENQDQMPYDMIVYHLSTGDKQVYKDVIPGMPHNEMHGGKMPVQFFSFSNNIAFTAQAEFSTGLYYYDFETATTNRLKSEYSSYFYGVFSADGQYRYVIDEGIHKGDQLVKPLQRGDILWAPKGNNYMYRNWMENKEANQYILTSMDHPDKQQTFLLKPYERVVGFTPNGDGLIIMK